MKIKIDSKRLRFLALMGARGCLGEAVYNLAEENENFSVLTADLGIASGFQRFMLRYPERFLNVGIAEQNMIGIAAGLADENHPVIVTSWAPFATYRCADQIRNYLGIMNSNVKVIGMDSGITSSRLGESHYGLGDIAMLRAMPNITILSPCDGIEICQAVEASIGIQGPVYIRLTGGQRLPFIHKDPSYTLKIGQAEVVQEGRDVLLIATGTILEQCISVFNILKNNGISCTLINMSTIKPLDSATLFEFMNHRIVVTVEEHNVLGGLGAAVAETMAPLKHRPPHLILGIGDFVPETGTYQYLLETCGLLDIQIVDSIQHFLEGLT